MLKVNKSDFFFTIFAWIFSFLFWAFLMLGLPFLYSSFVDASYVTDSYFYPFSEGTGATANNMTTATYSSTLVGSPTWIDGVYDKALQFNGSSQYGQVTGFGTAVGADTAGSVSLWYKLEAGNTGGYILGYSDPDVGAVDEFRIGIGTTSINPFFLNNGVTLYYGNVAYTSGNTWHNLVITSNGSTLKVYVDGVEKTMTDTTGTNSGQWLHELTTEADADYDLFTGVLYRSSGQYYYQGDLDDLRYYNSALTQAQITDLYNNTQFTDTFDTYSNGNLSGNGNWLDLHSYMQVVSTQSQTPSRSIYIGAYPTDSLYNTSFYSSSGYLTYYVYLKSGETWGSDLFLYRGGADFGFQFRKASGWGYYDGTSHYLGTPVEDVWHKVQLKWQVNSGVLQFAYNFGSSAWSSWIDARFHADAEKQAVNQILLSSDPTNKFYTYYDSFSSAIIPLSCYDYTTYSSCVADSCCWYPLTGDCYDCDAGACSGTRTGCPYCSTEAECGNYPECSWQGNYCLYGTGICGSDSLAYCSSEVDCEAVSGYWYGNFCNSNPEGLTETPSEPDFGIVGNALWSVAKFVLFIDPDILRAQLNSVKTMLMGKFPFAYIAMVKNLIDAQSITPGVLPEATIPFMGTTVKIFSFNDAMSMFPDYWDDIYDLLKYGMYILVVIYIFNRVRDFNVGL